jgi:hypothetical protein
LGCAHTIPCDRNCSGRSTRINAEN